jgi:hypothetical protein
LAFVLIKFFPSTESQKKRVETLRVKGLYQNYGSISKISAEIKKIQSKISSLEMKESTEGMR